jgi:hypothetical protein
MRQAFISYVRDDEETARRLAEELRRRGFQVGSIDRRIAPGESWVAQLVSEIAQSDVVFVLVSPRSEKSQWFNSEVALALAQAEAGRTRVVPVLVDRRVRPPELLQRIQGIELYDPERSQDQLDTLVRSLHATAVPGKDRASQDLAELTYLRSASEALAREKILYASKRAVWSSTIAAAVAALAAITGALIVILSFAQLREHIVGSWFLPFVLGVLASLMGVLLAAAFRWRLMHRDPHKKVD